ncbi:hypothetical protein BZM26_38355 [Paraburkholderia strydomiana]|nr:hypothetical protein BZM26_38355 [Paraburkholderia strydomiana]
MGSQHIDGDWLHGFVSWPDERIVRLLVSNQRPLFDAFVSKKKNGHRGHAPAMHSVDVLTIAFRQAGNERRCRVLTSRVHFANGCR